MTDPEMSLDQNVVRNRGAWSRASLVYLEKVKQVLDSLKEYWPLTLRQVYYRLVAAGTIQNMLAEYSKLSRILTKARLDGLVSWESMEDRSRRMLRSAGWENKDDFISGQMGKFLRGYRRDLLQTQDSMYELWIEKDALSEVCHKIAFDYCIPVVVARGFSSVSYVNNLRDRIIEYEKPTTILYFGDMDPSGYCMLPSMLDTLQNEMDLEDDVEGVRVALTKEQIETYYLPHNPDAIKWGDRRAKKYVEQFGELAVELDALPPATLEELVRQSIRDNLDLTKFREEQDQEKTEREELDDLCERVRGLIEDEID